MIHVTVFALVVVVVAVVVVAVVVAAVVVVAHRTALDAADLRTFSVASGSPIFFRATDIFFGDSFLRRLRLRNDRNDDRSGGECL